MKKIGQVKFDVKDIDKNRTLRWVVEKLSEVIEKLNGLIEEVERLKKEQ